MDDKCYNPNVFSMEFYEILWFKLCCYYQANAESFDRHLSNNVKMTFSEQKRISLNYALRLQNFVYSQAIRLRIPQEIMRSYGLSYKGGVTICTRMDRYI
jgi:hypothetical protein